MGITAEELSNAIVTLAKSTQVSYDRTYEMVISEITDVDTGLYRVSMEGNELIPAVCIEGLKGKLAIGDTVLVKVPNGELSSISESTTNLIEYKVKGSKTDTEALQELMNQYYDSGIKVSNIYIQDTSAQGLIAGDHDTITISVPTDASDRAAADRLFAAYANNYKYMRFSARFKTSFNDTHSVGRYGIKAVFEDTSGNTKEYFLDFDAFVGTPYNYPFFNTQEAIFDLSTDSLQRLLRFEFFETGFNYDHFAEGDPPVINDSIPNIFADSIDITFVDKLNIEPNSYYLYIETPNGTIVKETGDEVELIGKLVYNTTYLDLSSSSCLWYQKDPSITINSLDYDKFAGVGWRRINSTNVDRITVAFEDVATRNDYKLIVVYNDKITTIAEVQVVNYASLYDISIEKTTSGTDINLQLVNNSGSESLLGNWYVQLPTAQYSLVQLGTNLIEISDYLIYSYADFTCEVYLANDIDEEIITILTYHLDNTLQEDEDGVICSFNGADLYHYDANGQITIEESERQRTLTATIYFTNGSDPYISITSKVWYLGNQIITGTAYSPSDSMLQNISVDSSNNLIYNIRKVYRENYINNSVKLVITTLDGQQFAFFKDFTFIKDGAQGTNGSIYSAVIRPYNSSTFTPLTGFQALSYDNTTETWGSPLRLAPYVYEEDQLLSPNSYSCTWSLPNNLLTLTSGVDTPAFPHGCLVQGNNNPVWDTGSEDFEYWVKATITVNGTTLYCSYPVNVVLGALTETLDISSIASYIRYTASGFNPEYQNTEIKVLYGGETVNNCVSVATTNLLRLSSDNKKLYPVSHYTYWQAPDSSDSHIGVVLIEPEQDVYVVHPIVMYLNTYGNEAINSWDGTQLQIDTNGQFILAPQIGAGVKNQDNTFTGVVMGTNKGGGDLNNKIGLYGYQSGVASFGLMEDGTAFFGKASSGGRITIDGNSGTISGGDGGNNTNGMTITLANTGVSGSSDAIRIGNGKFYVKYDGTLFCTGATVGGILTAGAGSQIGPWLVSATSISTTTTSGDTAIFGTSGININNNFIVDAEGNITLNGTISWGTSPVKNSQYSQNGTTNWHNQETTTDQWKRDWDYSTGAYGTPYQYRSTSGGGGSSYSDADVRSFLANYYDMHYTTIGQAQLYSPEIYTAALHAGTGQADTAIAHVTSAGFTVNDGNDTLKIKLGLLTNSDTYDTPYLQLGAGSGVSGTQGLVQKFGNGIWIGSMNAQGTLSDPDSSNSPDGLYVDIAHHKVYYYVQGNRTELTQSGTATAVFA